MAIGGLLAAWDVALPVVEVLLGGSAIVLAAMVFLRARVTPAVVYVAAAVVAFLNGHMHVAEMPTGASLFPYGFGLVCATGILYAGGSMVARIFEVMPIAAACLVAFRSLNGERLLLEKLQCVGVSAGAHHPPAVLITCGGGVQ